MGPKIGPTWVLNWSQDVFRMGLRNGSLMGSKVVSKIGAKWMLKWDLKWFQDGHKMRPKWTIR